MNCSAGWFATSLRRCLSFSILRYTLRCCFVGIVHDDFTCDMWHGPRCFSKLPLLVPCAAIHYPSSTHINSRKGFAWRLAHRIAGDTYSCLFCAIVSCLLDRLGVAFLVCALFALSVIGYCLLLEGYSPSFASSATFLGFSIHCC